MSDEYYVPGTEETDPKKVIMSLQQVHENTADNAADIATNTANIATNTTNIAANTAAIAAIVPGVAAAPISNSLTGDVALNNTANYFIGPTVAQGSTGTWFASGTVQLTDPLFGSTVLCKLWDGATIIDSCSVRIATALVPVIASLSGFLASPAGNLRVECKSSNTTSVIAFNASGNSKDSTITAFRIA